MKEFIAYTDGRYDMNSHIGASGVVILDKAEKQVLYEWAKARQCYPTEDKKQFNQEQELASCIRTVMSVPKGSWLTIKTDSQYCVNVLGQRFNASANIRLIDTFFEKVREGRINVTFVKVKGHSGVWGNERADELCNIIAKEFAFDNTKRVMETENLCLAE